MLIVGAFLEQFGPNTPDSPSVPAVSAYDNGNGTATFTVASSSADSENEVFIQPQTGGPWTSVGTRTGNGLLSASVTDGNYFVYTRSALNEQFSTSAVITLSVTKLGSTTPRGVIATPVVPTAGGSGSCTDAPVLPGGRLPTPLSVSCYGQSILVPSTPTEPATGVPLLTRTYTVEVKGQQKASIEYVMRDRNGSPVNLESCLCLPADSSESLSVSESVSGSSSVPDDCLCPYKMVFRLAEYLSGGGCEFPVRLVDPANGKVAVDLSPEDTELPGVYFGEFAMIECATGEESDSTVIFSNKMYVIIGRNLWNNRMNCTGPAGPPSIMEIRLHLRDTDPQESYLLDNVAFADDEIALATYLPVQYWNEIPPPIGIHTTISFPYRYHWLMAIAGHLFLMVAEQQRRNNMAYSAGGIQINDQNREQGYEAAAKRRLDEYKEFVRRKKAEINLSNAYGMFGSAYGSRY